MPYEKSHAHQQVEHSTAKQRELEMLRQSFQERMQKEQIASQERIAAFNRYSSMLLAERSAYLSLRHTLVQDAIRSFPLNISPLVLLENNGIDLSFLLGQNEESNAINESIIDSMSVTKPLNVFITPLYIDAGVKDKDMLATKVYDSVYSSLESIFVNEYGRNSERPVIFYSAAWNGNVRAGLHAADELYYFLKDMPTIVVEPRYDGKTMKIMFSTWGLGYSSHIHSRQELAIPLDFSSMIAISAYERSKKALDSLSSATLKAKVLTAQRTMHEHNVSVFEQLNLEERITKRLNEIAKTGKSTELNELGDIAQLLYTSQDDIAGIADIITAISGMMIAALSDTHHLLTRDVTPRLPQIYKQYFGDYVNNDLLKVFGQIYECTYLKLSKEFPEQESRRLLEKEYVHKLLGSNSIDSESAIHDSLILKCKAIGGDSASIESLPTAELIDFYIDYLQTDDPQYRKTLLPFMTPTQKARLNSKLIDLF